MHVHWEPRDKFDDKNVIYVIAQINLIYFDKLLREVSLFSGLFAVTSSDSFGRQ